ncbi:unnamed protein product [Ostreobium quekettii]|uniref:RRM domain-containing protein n=1 Tax=Ostreobium quekettii TaxID=121088 RepID=A0A8S1J5C1_9CHLO|nr:unnamed protein product [Ostreobium quekettii]|eukprot:evm.model.scf_150EXC.7 EVM.evm.TU.scf_150EXC.7   scf_150EXC:46081-48069(+)
MENGEKLVIGKRCYVGNLAWRTSWQDLKDEFRKCGQVVYANVMRTEDGRSKGWGIVEFEHPEEALKAVETMNGLEIGGRPIMVREDREDRDVKQYNSAGRDGEGYGDQQYERTPRSPGGEHSELQVVVHGLPFRYTWRELKDLFNDKIGSVVHAEVVYGRDGRSRGYGTVRFDNVESAKKAIDELNNAELDGRRLGVKMDKYA